MTYIVSGGALNSTHSLLNCWWYLHWQSASMHCDCSVAGKRKTRAADVCEICTGGDAASTV